VHEVNYDRSLVTLNIMHGGPGVNFDYPEPSALEVFQILHDQCFFDFSSASKGGRCALLTAIRRRTKVTETLQFLSRMGVDFARISTTSHSSLHWAAEMAYDVRCLEYLCSTSAIENINRQDSWGWTPLHYAVVSQRYGYRKAALDKIQCLLCNGADPEIKGRRHPLFFSKIQSLDEFTPLELSRITDSDLSLRFEEKIAQRLVEELDHHDAEVFFDALEEHVEA